MESLKSVIFRFDELVAKPWPNGRGLTRDVVSNRLSNGSIHWLISIAELVEDAEFSHYEGCDRILTLIGGNPLDLHINGASPVRCDPLVPVYFPGDRPTRCSLPGGSTRAFNVFINRAEMRGTVSGITIANTHEVTLPDSPAAVHCVSGSVTLQGDVLRSGDTLIAPRDRVIRTGGTPATLAIVNLQTKSGNAQTN